MKSKDYLYPDVDDKATNKAIDTQEPYEGYWDKSEEYVLSFVKEVFKKRNFDSLLDLGCGEGRLTIKFSKSFSKVVALDPDEKRLKKARKNIKSAKVNGVKFLRRSFLDVNLPDNNFDVVICSHVIQHISTDDLTPFINKIHQILKKNGLLILLTTHSRKNQDFYLKSFVKKGKLYEPEISRLEFNDLIDNKKNILPVHLFSLSNLKKHLEKFKIIEMKVFHDLLPRNLMDKVIFRDKIANVSFLKSFFGTDVLIIAEKIS